LLLVAAVVGQSALDRVAAQSPRGEQVPRFEVDPLWPKQLPNNWIIGSAVGVAVDANDRIWLLHRPSTLLDNEKAAALEPPRAECCYPAPPVLVFDQAGTLVNNWGGAKPGVDEWPDSEHGLFIDYKGNVWLGGNGAKDAQVMKFTQDGKFLMKIGNKGRSAGSNDTANFRQATTVWVDESTNEAYIADGYGNRRVAVFDADTGQYKRHWGAYGNKPDDADPYNSGSGNVAANYNPDGPPAKQFGRAVHCAAVSRDGLVYVCDRTNNRIQIFRRDGTFVREAFINKKARGFGSAFDVGFSIDPGQRFVFNLDGMDEEVDIMGQFYAVHSIAVDSKGNIYTAETQEGKRLQRFLYRGMVPAPPNPAR
jgi:sugar lactone lactonase YvrE